MAASPPRLGKGLGSLISRPATPAAAAQKMPAPEFPSPAGSPLRDIQLDRIQPNPAQPRTVFSEARLAELIESIRRRGVIQPIVVRERADLPQHFELIAGERRWRAAREAGLGTIPAIVRAYSDDESMEVALIENLQREDLTPLERATAYQRYLDRFGVHADDLAAKLGESRANVSNYLRLLRLPQEVQELLRIGEIGMGQARAIAAIADSQRQLGLARLAVRRRLSVRQVETLVKDALESRPTGGAAKPGERASGDDRHTEELGRAFGKALGVPVRILAGRRKNSGRIVISFETLEEFDAIADRMGVQYEG